MGRKRPVHVHDDGLQAPPRPGRKPSLGSPREINSWDAPEGIIARYLTGRGEVRLEDRFQYVPQRAGYPGPPSGWRSLRAVAPWFVPSLEFGLRVPRAVRGFVRRRPRSRRRSAATVCRRSRTSRRAPKLSRKLRNSNTASNTCASRSKRRQRCLRRFPSRQRGQIAVVLCGQIGIAFSSGSGFQSAVH